MKTFLLFLLAIGATLASPRESRAADVAIFDWIASIFQDRPEEMAPSRRLSPQAVCREIEAPTDEGYGVTGHERRVVCDRAP